MLRIENKVAVEKNVLLNLVPGESFVADGDAVPAKDDGAELGTPLSRAERFCAIKCWATMFCTAAARNS